MIYTITLNPSLDYYMLVDDEFIETEVNRSKKEIIKIGGKGINVSLMLEKLNIESTAIVLAGGFTGNYIVDELKKHRLIDTRIVDINGANRINVKIHHDDKALCVNGSGPVANEATKKAIYQALQKITKDDYCLICGSSMKGLDDEFIYELAKYINVKEARLIVDMEKISFDFITKTKPYLIKPNLYEFGLLMEGVTNDNILDKLKECNKLTNANILLSLGSDGAILTTKEHNLKLDQKEVHSINKVGSGDAMLATFIGAMSKTNDEIEAIRYAGAAGSATCSTLGDVTKELIEQHYVDTKTRFI